MASNLFQFKYGDYSHTPGEVYPAAVEILPMPNVDGMKWATRIRMKVVGDFCNSDGTQMTYTDITNKINALAIAYGTDYKDAAFYDPAGVITPHAIINDDENNLSGTQVVHRSWDHALPANEYVNTRSFSITIQALYRTATSEIFQFTETTKKQGTGGPKWKLYNRWDGVPVREEVSANSDVFHVTTGRIVGLTTWPDALAYAPPFWPDDEQQWKRVITQHAPKFWGDPTFTKGTHYTTDYSYYFHRIGPGSGWPSSMSNPGNP